MTESIAVTGNITSIPERRDANGTPVARFGLASTERRLENGQWIDGHTNYYNVSVFRQLAENVLASLTKGQRVVVAGKLRVRQWEHEGRTRTSVDLEASSIGPDLKFGTAVFTKSGATRAPAPQDDTQEWATAEVNSETAPASVPEPRTESVGLVSAGHWGDTAEDDAAPF